MTSSLHSDFSTRQVTISLIAPFGLLTKGTTAARVLPIGQALAARGHRVRLIVPPWDDPPGSPDRELRQSRSEFSNGVEIIYLPVRPGPQPLRLPWRLAQAALASKPDVIHIFKPKAFSGLAALLLKLRGQTFVLDSDDWEGPGGYNDVNPYSWLEKRLFAWQERDLPGRAAAVTVASRTLETQIWSLGLEPAKVLYLPNGVSPGKYTGWDAPANDLAARRWRQKLGLHQDQLVLLAYTRFVEFKPARLLQIMQAILKLLPDGQAETTRLVVVGGSFHGEEQDFKRLAEYYSLSNKIILTGQVDLDELPAILRAGDVAIYPFDDNLINRARCSAKFLDLLMAGIPVVTEAVGELSNYLINGQGGLIVPPGDEGAFAEAVIYLAGLSPQQRTAIGRAGSPRLQTNFNWDKLVQPLEDLYRKVVLPRLPE